MKFLQAENAEIRKEIGDLREEEARVSQSKLDILRKVLTLEVGYVLTFGDCMCAIALNILKMSAG